MRTNINRKLLTKQKILIYATCFSILIYFIFHAIVGDRGILSYFHLKQKLDDSKVRLDDLRVKRMELEHNVNLLKPPVDPDMLDEQARRVLGIAKPQEKVFKPDSHE